MPDSGNAREVMTERLQTFLIIRNTAMDLTKRTWLFALKLPVLGAARCVYNQEEVTLGRIGDPEVRPLISNLVTCKRSCACHVNTYRFLFSHLRDQARRLRLRTNEARVWWHKITVFHEMVVFVPIVSASPRLLIFLGQSPRLSASGSNTSDHDMPDLAPKFSDFISKSDLTSSYT